MNLKLLNRLLEAEKYFTKKKYVDIIELAKELFERGQFDLCEKQLEKLPNNGDLLEKLVEKLKGKSVAKTLKLIQEGKVGNDWTGLKGLMSLGVHLIIEREHGNTEYEILLPIILEKVNEISYDLLSRRLD